MTRLRLLADDLTGTLDAAAPFAAALGARLPVGLDAPPETGALDADTRERPAAEARRRVAECAGWLAGGRPAFHKLDSLWRGHAAVELAALLPGFATIVVAPAFPAQGRLTCGGRLVLRDGTRGPDLAASLAAKGLAPRRATAGRIPDAPGLWLCDATAEADLQALAGAELPGPVLWAGSGGLARAMAGPGPAARVPGGPMLLLCGSRHAVSTGLLAGLPSGSLRCPATPEEAARDADRALARTATGLPAALALHAACAAPAATWRRMAARLAAGPPSALLGVIGGRSLRDLCEALGATGLDVQGEVRPGLPLSTLWGGCWDGVALLSRSGAFDDRGVFEALMRGEAAAA